MINQTEIHRKVTSNAIYERKEALNILYNSFEAFPDKEEAWNDLHRLTKDEDSYVRRGAAGALGTAFPYVTDKAAAWNDLIRLTKNEDWYVRWDTTGELGTAFPYVTDKAAAWNDLLRLMKDEDWYVRRRAVEALGTAFSHAPDKEEAWNDLYRLTGDPNHNVRASANHSLGSVSIFKATAAESEDEFRKEIENAIAFFEKSVTQAIYSNPATFCLPFYRSFYTLTFKKLDAETEVQNYLTKAKRATEGSESKEKLLEAVENLANALKTVQDAHREMDFNIQKRVLKDYWRYCEQAAELLEITKDKAPLAAETIKRGMPIIGERIKKIIEEIKYKANLACQESRGLPAEEIVCAVHQEVQSWSISDQEQLTQNIETLIFVLKSKIPPIPENKHIYEEIDKIGKESDIVKQYKIVAVLVALIPTARVIEKAIEEILNIIRKIETFATQIIFDLEERGVKVREEDKRELKQLAADLKKANKEQLTDFVNELQNLFNDPKIQQEFEKQAPKHKSLIKKTIKGILNELGIALSAAITAEALLPHVDTVMSQIVILSQINPALAATLLLIPLITLKEKTLK